MSFIGKAWNWAKDAVTPDKAPESAQYTPDQANFRYGLGGNETYAHKQSDRYDEQQQQLAALGADAYNRQAPTQGMPASIQFAKSDGQSYLQNADDEARRQQLAALGGISTATSNLNQFAQGGSNATQGAIQQAADMGARQQYGMARTQPGGGGAALRNAAFNAAGIMNNAGNTAAIASQQDRAQQLAALGYAQQGAGQLATYAGQVRGADQAYAQAQAGQANYDAGAQNQFTQGQQQMEFNVGQNNLNASLTSRAQNDQTALQTYGISQGYDQMRNDLASGQQQAGITYEAAKHGGAQLASQNFANDADRSLNYVKAYLGTASSTAGAAAKASDVRAKTDIRLSPHVAEAIVGAHDANARYSLDFNQDEFRTPDVAGRIGLGKAGDERWQRLRALLGPHDKEAAATTNSAGLDSAYQGGNLPDTEYPDLRPARGYEYSYKNPERHGGGRYVGPMAQDLEHLPGVVKEDPSGTKMVDTSRLALVNTAAVSEQQRRLDRLERIAALGGSPGTPEYDVFPMPSVRQPDYAALDRAVGWRR